MVDCASPAPKPEGRTVTSYCATGAPWPSIAAIVVRPGATPNRNRLVGLAGRTSTTRGSAAKTEPAARLSCRMRPAPASIASGMPARSVALFSCVSCRMGGAAGRGGGASCAAASAGRSSARRAGDAHQKRNSSRFAAPWKICRV